jgi:Protein of unknown function (DUF4232)
MAKQHGMRLASCCVAVATSLVLAACGGSSSKSSSSSATTPSSSSTGTSNAPTTTVASTPSPTVPATHRPARCRASGLTLRFIGQQGATGHGELGFALANVSGATCRTFGFPGILFLDKAGNPLPTRSVRKTQDLFGSAPAVALALAPGASASFRIGVTHGINSSVGCTTAYGLQVIPPDDTASLRTTIPQGAYECTQATVSPLRPGESAYP